MPKVSVIVPVYNVERYIEKCLNSLVNQSLKDIEIIVVNDGTKDNSQDIIDEFCKKYNNIISLVKENGGLSSARNYGMKHAKGEYIGFVDSDDWVETEMFEKLYNKASRDNLDVVACDLYYVYDDHKDYARSQIKSNILDKEKIKKCFISIYPTAWNKIYKTSLLKENDIQFKEGIWFEDVEFTYKLLPYINSIGSVQEPLYNYVQRDGAITRCFDKRLYHFIDNFNGTVDYYKEKQLYDKYKKELEYAYVRYIYATFIKKCTNYNLDDYKVAVNEAIKNVKNNFPSYRKNPYFYKSLKGIYLLLFNKRIARTVYMINNRNRGKQE